VNRFQRASVSFTSLPVAVVHDEVAEALAHE